MRLDETVGRVTDMVIASGRPDKELVVELQSFDRLKQEFEALGDALTRYAEATNSIRRRGEERAQLGQEVIAAITLHELKDRLLVRLQDDLPEMAAPVCRRNSWPNWMSTLNSSKTTSARRFFLPSWG